MRKNLILLLMIITLNKLLLTWYQVWLSITKKKSNFTLHLTASTYYEIHFGDHWHPASYIWHKLLSLKRIVVFSLNNIIDNRVKSAKTEPALQSIPCLISSFVPYFPLFTLLGTQLRNKTINNRLNRILNIQTYGFLLNRHYYFSETNPLRDFTSCKHGILPLIKHGMPYYLIAEVIILSDKSI